MTRPLALAPLASIAVALVAVGCHPVDLGHDGQTGGNASGGGDGTGGALAGTGGARGTGGDGPGTGGHTGGTGGHTSGSGGSGGGTAGLCPTTVAGTATKYAFAPYTPQGLAIDSASIYWTGEAQGLGAGAVLRTDLATGTTVEIANAALDPSLPSSSFDYPSGIALAGGNVVWTAGSGGEVVRVPASGGAATTLYHDASHFHVPGTGTTPHTFSTDGTNVYWNDVWRDVNLMTNALLAAPLSGSGPITTMASTVVDPTDSQAPPFMPLSLRIDGATAFYTLWAGGTSMSVTRRVGIDGQNGADLFGVGFLLAPDGATLYQAFDSFVESIPAVGGAPTIVLMPAGPNVFETYQAIVLFGSDVYLTSYGGSFDGQNWVEGCGWVKKVPKSGGTATILWSGAGRPFDIAVDATGVTWSDIDNDEVVRLVP